MQKIAIRKHMPVVLTYAGVCGVVGTAIMAVKATPKALTIIEQEKMYRSYEGDNKLTKKRDCRSNMEMLYSFHCVRFIDYCMYY